MQNPKIYADLENNNLKKTRVLTRMFKKNKRRERKREMGFKEIHWGVQDTFPSQQIN